MKLTCYHKQVASNLAERVNLKYLFLIGEIKASIFQGPTLCEAHGTPDQILFTLTNIYHCCIFVTQKQKITVMNIRSRGICKNTMTTCFYLKRLAFIYNWVFVHLKLSMCQRFEFLTSPYSLLICSLTAGYRFWQDNWIFLSCCFWLQEVRM